MNDIANSGLAGVIAGETAICSVNSLAEGLSYRGYQIEDLAENATFEEVAYLLIYGELPTEHDLNTFKNRLKAKSTLPKGLISILEILPPSSEPMDILRTVCSVMGSLEPETKEYNAKEIAERLLALLPVAITYWYSFHKKITPLNICMQSNSIAGNFISLLHVDETFPLECIRAIDVSLILYAEHEFNASTFAARVCAATKSDFYSAITAAIGTLRGPLHGGANEEAIKLITSYSDPLSAEQGIKKLLSAKTKVMGFGHRVYTKSDPRSKIIQEQAKILSEIMQDNIIYNVAQTIDKFMWDEKKLFPNLDFYSAVVYYFCQIPVNIYTPLFVIARLAGWSAHIIEQRENNKLIRPLARYIGSETKKFISLGLRKR